VLHNWLGGLNKINLLIFLNRYRKLGVVAFDIAGPEKGFSSVIHQRAFELVRLYFFINNF
jgi:hypothetical protein